jgi:hypothetical protein
MAGLATLPRSAPLPENVAQIDIEYPTGLRASAGCAEDVVTVAVPTGSEPPFKPGCGENSGQTLVERAGEWLRDMIRH